MARKASPQKTKSQSADEFLSVAKRLECDDDKARFEAKLGKIVKARPQKQGK